MKNLSIVALIVVASFSQLSASAAPMASTTAANVMVSVTVTVSGSAGYSL